MKTVVISPCNPKQMINYTNWLEKCGISYRILADGDKVKQNEVLLLTGGPDVGSVPKRDARELLLVKECYGRIPIVGICRGLQVTNVALGGTLHEDLKDPFMEHKAISTLVEGHTDPVKVSSFHKVEIGGFKHQVNSRHHQAIKDIAPGLTPLAVSEDGLIEAALGEKCLLVQWHPERKEIRGTWGEAFVQQSLKVFLNEEE